MEGSSGTNRELYPRLLDLIPNESEWLMRRDQEACRFGVSEDKKLELRLGPPGEDWFDKGNSKKSSRDRAESLLSLGCFSSLPYKTSNKQSSNTNNSISAGAKRVFLDTVEAKAGEQTWVMNHNINQNQKLTSSEKLGGITFSTPWSSTPPSPSAFQVKTHQQQQKPKPQFFQFPSSVPQSLPVMSKEQPQTCRAKVADLPNPEKKACSPPSASVTANTAVPNSSQKRTSPVPVVGWPPIRSFRKNLASSSSSKPASEIRDHPPPADVNGEKTEASRKGLFVKINMDGVPIGRKVDLKAYDSYEKLSSAVDELFRGLLAAQGDSSAAEDQNKAEPKAITGLLNGKEEYTLVYEDNEGDRMLVGDVPWHMFVSTVKRLRVLKSSELPRLLLSSSKPEKTRVDCGVK